MNPKIELDREFAQRVALQLEYDGHYDMSRTIVLALNRLLPKPEKTTCNCGGWGCYGCCSSEAEIRARQGTFG